MGYANIWYALGAFGWTGSYARKDNNGIKSLSKRRYAISGEYVTNDWTFRSEYIHSTGYGFKTVYNDKTNLSETEVDYEKVIRLMDFMH